MAVSEEGDFNDDCNEGSIVSSTSNSTYETWNDDELVYQHFNYSFKPILPEDAGYLCTLWWQLYSGTPSDMFSSIAACMALHIVDPTKQHAYVIDYLPTKEDLPESDDVASILRLARELGTNRTEISETFPIPSDKYDDDMKPSICAFNKWYSSLAPKNQVGFTALVALSSFKVVFKEVASVSKYINDCLMTDYIKVYKRQPGGVTIPPPTVGFLQNLNFNRGDTLVNMVLSRMLAVYKIVKTKDNKKSLLNLLERAILSTASRNGLKLVTLVMDVTTTLNLDRPLLFGLIRSFSDECTESMAVLQKFFEDTHSTDLWPWCRALNESYYSDLQVSKNFKMAYTLAAIIWPKGDEPGWEMGAFEKISEIPTECFEIAKKLNDSRKAQ